MSFIKLVKFPNVSAIQVTSYGKMMLSTRCVIAYQFAVSIWSIFTVKSTGILQLVKLYENSGSVLPHCY